jgi:hypothetical protein
MTGTLALSAAHGRTPAHSLTSLRELCERRREALAGRLRPACAVVARSALGAYPRAWARAARSCMR